MKLQVRDFLRYGNNSEKLQAAFSSIPIEASELHEARVTVKCVDSLLKAFIDNGWDVKDLNNTGELTLCLSIPNEDFLDDRGFDIWDLEYACDVIGVLLHDRQSDELEDKLNIYIVDTYENRK